MDSGRQREQCIYSEVCTNQCKVSCMRYLEMKYLLDNSGIPKSRQKFNKISPEDVDLKAFQQLADIRDSIVDFVNKGKSLYIYSDNCGNGKTTWGIKLLLQYFNEVWIGNGFEIRGLFVNIPTLLSDVKLNITNKSKQFNETLKMLETVDIVVLDDIAATEMTQYEQTQILAIINNRILNDKSTIYTGNIPPYKLNANMGERIASRINDSIQIELRGGDYRYGSASSIM